MANKNDTRDNINNKLFSFFLTISISDAILNGLANQENEAPGSTKKPNLPVISKARPSLDPVSVLKEGKYKAAQKHNTDSP
ncbi:hypothetical protein [Erwinia sp. SLM-02]|uniref:hypothetical protein n=1 Tax=Erwinia sp. SLM-02 TaxID=3020057 RepID=UPI003080F622